MLDRLGMIEIPARVRPVLLLSCLGLGGCVRLGDLGGGVGDVLARDAAELSPDDASTPGRHEVVAQGLAAGDWDDRLVFSLYRPRTLAAAAPAIVFLPGRVAPESQYESYARALASRGFVVAVRGWYGPFLTDQELAEDASRLARWLIESGLADPQRIGVAGHSMGAKNAIWAALDDRRFRAVVALDPDDNGRQRIARGPIGRLQAPLLLVGAEVGWKGASVCAPRDRNYERFFEGAPAGTLELTLARADHVQLMDRPDDFGMSICRVGAADSRLVRSLARRAMIAFFAEHLGGDVPPTGLALEPLGSNGRLRIKGEAGLAAVH